MKLQILTPGSWVMSAEDLNTKGDDVKYMQLSFAGDANTNNVFAEKWQAQSLVANSPKGDYDVLRNHKDGYTNGQSAYLVLNKIDDKGALSYNYLRVDTSYYESTGATYKLYNKLATSAATLQRDAKGNVVENNGYATIDTLGINLPDDAFRFKFTKKFVDRFFNC